MHVNQAAAFDWKSVSHYVRSHSSQLMCKTLHAWVYPYWHIIIVSWVHVFTKQELVSVICATQSKTKNRLKYTLTQSRIYSIPIKCSRQWIKFGVFFALFIFALCNWTSQTLSKYVCLYLLSVWFDSVAFPCKILACSIDLKKNHFSHRRLLFKYQSLHLVEVINYHDDKIYSHHYYSSLKTELKTKYRCHYTITDHWGALSTYEKMLV